MKVNKNLPNYICIFRIFMIPFVILFMLDNGIVNSIPMYIRMIIAGVLFAVAMLSDMVDGKIARKYNLVSDFGKFLDPIADKLLVISIMLVFVELNLCSSVAIIIIIAREFMISGLRMQAASKGEVIAANMWGKVKTTVQGVVMTGSFVYLIVMYCIKDMSVTTFAETAGISYLPINIGMWVLAAVTVISAIPYFKNGAKYIKMI